MHKTGHSLLTMKLMLLIFAMKIIKCIPKVNIKRKLHEYKGNAIKLIRDDSMTNDRVLYGFAF